MAKKFEISISFRGFAPVHIYTYDYETIEDLEKLTDQQLVERIMDWSELVNFIDDQDIDVEDIREIK